MRACAASAASQLSLVDCLEVLSMSFDEFSKSESMFNVLAEECHVRTLVHALSFFLPHAMAICCGAAGGFASNII